MLQLMKRTALILSLAFGTAAHASLDLNDYDLEMPSDKATPEEINQFCSNLKDAMIKKLDNIDFIKSEIEDQKGRIEGIKRYIAIDPTRSEQMYEVDIRGGGVEQRSLGQILEHLESSIPEFERGLLEDMSDTIEMRDMLLEMGDDLDSADYDVGECRIGEP